MNGLLLGKVRIYGPDLLFVQTLSNSILVHLKSKMKTRLRRLVIGSVTFFVPDVLVTMGPLGHLLMVRTVMGDTGLFRPRVIFTYIASLCS